MLTYDLTPAAPGLPTVVVLHGLGDSKEGWKPVAPMLGLDDWGFCFVEAPAPYDVGWSWFDIDLDAGLRVDAAGVARSHGLLVELLAALQRDHGLPCERLALLGFSQGCLMALEVALRHPRPLLAVAAVSGWLHRLSDWPAAFGAAVGQQRILATHGRQDPLIPITLARERVVALQRLGVPIRWAEFAKAHHLDPDDELPALRRHLLDAWAASPHRPAPGAHA